MQIVVKTLTHTSRFEKQRKTRKQRANNQFAIVRVRR